MAEMSLRGARDIDRAALVSLRGYGGPRTEPHLVAAIFRDPRLRQAIISAVDPRWQRVRVHTVFVHVRPRVSYSCDGVTRRCELGDAFILYRERLRTGQMRRQAVLFQAKRWSGPERNWVNTDPDQHALYQHWPPFQIAGGPSVEIRLPPGDYGRVLGLDARLQPDVPRVSPRRPTEPGCTRNAHPWMDTIGTLGRAVRGVIRFQVGECVEGDWAIAVGDIIWRVGRACPGPTYPSGSRGGATARRSLSSIDDMFDGIDDLPPEEDDDLGGDEGPLSMLLIDATDLE
ncbi:MAG: hypothetical protein ACRDQZ_23465 [Mycobacteriales bacterium]